MAGTMLAQQMLSFEKRHSIQPPSLTHAHELRASIGTKRRLANETSFPARRSSGSPSQAHPNRLPELSTDDGSSPKRGKYGRSRKRGSGSTMKPRRSGKGARSLEKLDEMKKTGRLSEQDHKKAASTVQKTVYGGAVNPSAEAVELVSRTEGAETEDEEVVEEELELDAAEVAAEKRDILTPMTPSRHMRVHEPDEVQEDNEGGKTGSSPSNHMSLFGLYANMPLLDALANGGEGYQRPDTAEIIDDPDELPPLTTRMSSIDGFQVLSPKPSRSTRALGRGVQEWREAKEEVCPDDFVDDITSEAASDAGEDVTSPPSKETQMEILARERGRAAKQLARAPSRGETFHKEALTVNNFGLIGPGSERKLWWQKPENEAVSSEEVPEQLAVPSEPKGVDWKAEAAAAGPELFVGTSARQAFFDLSKAQHREWSAEGLPDHDTEGGEPNSGRRHYLRECELTHKVPQPILVQSKSNKVIDLSYRRLGNTTGSAYAGALLKAAAQQGVHFEELKLRENNLTTRGIVAIAATIHSCPLLRVIDMSSNDFSEQASEALAKALQNHPMIQQISMSNCNIEDKDGAHLIEALSHNSSITYLDLSRNQLGAGAGAWCRDEACPATMHSKISATAKLATMLTKSSLAQLHTLNLSYNNLGAKHFELMSVSLKFNNTLQRLDLSWNSCGDEGAMALTDALRPNKALLTLDLTRTGIGERGAMVIADVLKENQGLEEIKLDENPVGQRGGRAILRALRKMLQYGWTRKISVTRSNFKLVDESQNGTTRWIEVDDPLSTVEMGATRKILQFDRNQPLFDPADAGGHHKCNLEDAYQRMVAWELVELAWTEEGENWSDERIDGSEFNLEEPEPGEIWMRADHPVLPDSGLLTLNYVNTPRVPRFKDVIEPPMLLRLLEMMNEKEVTDHGMALLRLAAQEFWFTAEYVGLLVKMQKDSESRVIAVAALYPRIVDIANAQYHVLDYLTRAETRKLEVQLGILFHFMPTNPTGHYKLDLVNPYHRIVKQRLVEIAKEEKDFRQKNVANRGGQIIDTSQHGDWENFRNETLNKEKYDFDTTNSSSANADLKPPAILEFDYVSTSVAHRLLNLPAMSDDVFDLFLLDLFRVRQCVDIMENVAKRGSAKSSKRRDEDQSGEQAVCDELNATVNSGFLLDSEGSLHSTQELELEPEPQSTQEPEGTFANFDSQQQQQKGTKTKTKKTTKQKQSAVLDEFGEKEKKSLQLIQALWRGKMVRHMATVKKRAEASLKARQVELLKLAQASQKAREGEMQVSRSVASLGSDVFAVAQSFITQRKPPRRKVRNCWWIPAQHHKVVEMTKGARLQTIAKRQVMMLRRSTAQWYFSVAQCTKILEAIPASAHVEAIVTMFSRITDIEHLDVGKLLGHKTFDIDGNGWITEDELAQLQSESSPDVRTQRYLQACHRLGHANLFNPLFPEREYALNLRDWAEMPPDDTHPHGDKKGRQDERRVAELLIVLSAEPGDNTVNETYNGNYIEVENRWDSGVPHQGMFCTTYNTRRNGASLALRLPLCRALLAPGRGRYKSTLALCPLNARAIEAIGDDEKLQNRYRDAADCEDPREELISLIIHAEMVRGGGSPEGAIKTERKLRHELSLLQMNPVQHNARAEVHDSHPSNHSVQGGEVAHTKKTASFWKHNIFDETELGNVDEFDQQAQDWENDWMLDADGGFVPKEEIRSRLKAAEERSVVPAENLMTDTGPDTEGLQATVSLALNFRRQVKRPLLKARSAVSELGEKQLAEIAHAEREIKEKIHSRLVRAQGAKRWSRVRDLVMRKPGN